MSVSSGMSIRMFPLTSEGDWTAAVSLYGWVLGGGRLRNEQIEFIGCRQGVSRSRP